MILVTVHTYNGSYGDEVQLLGIYSHGDEARLAVYELMKHYIKQYFNKRNVFPGHIEDEGLNGLEAIENLKNLFPDTYKEVVDILNPEFHVVCINSTYSIKVTDDYDDFNERTYDTGLPSIWLGGYIE